MFSSLSLNVKIVLLLLVAGVIAASSGLIYWQWQKNKYEGQLASQLSSFDRTISAVNLAAAKVAQDALAERDAATLKLAALDKEATEQRSHDLAENKRLSNLLTSGGRVSVNGTCTSSSSVGSMPKTDSSSSVGDGSSIELSQPAGLNILGIREGIIRDQAALKFFQDRERGLTQ